jgi:hypothetical protein
MHVTCTPCRTSVQASGHNPGPTDWNQHDQIGTKIYRDTVAHGHGAAQDAIKRKAQEQIKQTHMQQQQQPQHSDTQVIHPQVHSINPRFASPEVQHAQAVAVALGERGFGVSDMFGLAGGVAVCASFVPQLLHVFREKQAMSFSALSLFLAASGSLLFAFYHGAESRCVCSTITLMAQFVCHATHTISSPIPTL